MTDRILVHVPNGQVLALTLESFQEALKLGAELMPFEQQNVPQTSPELLTANEMAARSDAPASWWLEAAKSGRVPSIQFGKYRRFPASILSETDTASVAKTDSK